MSKPKRTIKIIGERDIELNLSNPAHHERIASIGKALSSPIRLQILALLKDCAMSVQEIAHILNIPVSSTAVHIRCLEDAQLIITEVQPGNHGSMRVCICSMQTFTLSTVNPELSAVDNSVSIEMPIGHYFQCKIEPTCGLADENGAIDMYDSPSSFYSPNRTKAQLLWFRQGYVEYRFQNLINPMRHLSELSFSVEICSEAPGYLNDWPSDITITVNGIELTTFCSPGDFGDRRGKLTPAIWPNGRTQYGLLKTFSIRENGGYIDHMPVNPSISIKQLELDKCPYIALRIGIKEDAKHIGGINIFGEKYGDYPQGIIMTFTY